MWTDASFTIGPAVDDAAAAMDEADAGIVWLTPLAREVAESMRDAPGSVYVVRSLFVHDVDVPLKGGSHYRTTAVNPFFGFPVNEESYEATRDLILRTFDDSNISVAVKRQNTDAFLDEAIERSVDEKRWEEKLQRISGREQKDE